MSSQALLRSWISKDDTSFKRPSLRAIKRPAILLCIVAVAGILLTAVHVTSGIDSIGNGVSSVKSLLHNSNGSPSTAHGHGTSKVEVSRHNDYNDIFADWKGRKECGFGSMDLHAPLPKLCETPQSLFDAMTYGVRTEGYNMPFEPAGCDLHFYSTAEICEIFGRFEKVIVLGDSLMRQTEWSLAMLLQENYWSGGQADWVAVEEGECKCEYQSASMFCMPSEASTEAIYENSPVRLLCPNMPKISYRPALKWPLPQDELEAHIANVTSAIRPTKPYAFIMGHATWNDCNATATLAWTDQILAAMHKVRPYLVAEPTAPFPRAFISSSAAGWGKPAAFVATQGNDAVPIFQNLIAQPLMDRGFDFFSPFNMSVNALIPDGTHTGIRVNLLKAMTLVNWLAMVDTRLWNPELPQGMPKTLPDLRPRPDIDALWAERGTKPKEKKEDEKEKEERERKEKEEKEREEKAKEEEAAREAEAEADDQDEEGDDAAPRVEWDAEEGDWVEVQ